MHTEMVEVSENDSAVRNLPVLRHLARKVGQRLIGMGLAGHTLRGIFLGFNLFLIFSQFHWDQGNDLHWKRVITLMKTSKLLSASLQLYLDSRAKSWYVKFFAEISRARETRDQRREHIVFAETANVPKDFLGERSFRGWKSKLDSNQQNVDWFLDLASKLRDN